MAVKYNNAIREARLLIGTPYSELDCINFIKRIIRSSFGGVKDYTTAGTNTLWDSYNASGKYRDLTWRQEGIAGARAGMLAFKRYGADDEGHVGLVTGEGTVIHSSSVNGRGVVETPLSASEGWDLLAIHRYITVKEEETMIEAIVPTTVLYRAVVSTNKTPLSVREKPKTGTVVGSVPKGRIVEVISDEVIGWPLIRSQELVGYASADYLMRIGEETQGKEAAAETELPESVLEGMPMVTIIDSAGNRFDPVGDFRVYFDGID